MSLSVCPAPAPSTCPGLPWACCVPATRTQLFTFRPFCNQWRRLWLPDVIHLAAVRSENWNTYRRPTPWAPTGKRPPARSGPAPRWSDHPCFSSPLWSAQLQQSSGPATADRAPQPSITTTHYGSVASTTSPVSRTLIFTLPISRHGGNCSFLVRRADYNDYTKLSQPRRGRPRLATSRFGSSADTRHFSVRALARLASPAFSRGCVAVCGDLSAACRQEFRRA